MRHAQSINFTTSKNLSFRMNRQFVVSETLIEASKRDHLTSGECALSTSEHYDVVVIGRSVAGLIAAALLAKRRFRVRVFDLHAAEQMQNVPLFGMETAPIWPKILDELGLVHAMRTHVVGQRGIGIALQDRRFVLHPDRAKRGQELSECFPNETKGLLQLFEQASTQGPLLTPLLEGELEGPPVGFGSRRRWQKQVDFHQLSSQVPSKQYEPKVVSSLFKAVLAIAGQFDIAPETATPAQWRTFWHLCHGEAVMKTGRQDLESILIERLESSGGVFDTRKQVKRLETRRRKIRGVHLSGGSFIGADHYILANGAAQLSSLVDDWDREHDQMHWSKGAIRTNPTVDKAPHVGWSVSDSISAASQLSNGEFWLGCRSQDPSASANQVFGPLMRAQAEIGRCDIPSKDRIDDFGIYHCAYDDPFKNAYCVGDWVMPGLGLEGDGLTAWQTAHAITKSASSFWKSSPKR